MIIKNNIPILYILTELRTPLLFVSLIAVITGVLPAIFHEFLSDIPISIATTLGVAISILLSYNINQSYERWWEARKIWGEIVNDSRTLIMQLQLYVADESAEIEAMGRRHIAWNYCLGRRLRKIEAIADLKPWFSAEDFARLDDSLHVPLSILSMQTASLHTLHQQGALDRFSQIQLDNTLSRLTAAMGKCERIKNTVFPPIYRFGLHGAIYLFTVFMSLSVAFKLQHFVLEFSILVIVSAVFFFLEKAAFRMQDPFENRPTDTPMTALAETIERDVLRLLHPTATPAPPTSVHQFYVL